MKIAEELKNKFVLSFEIFPPKTPKGEEKLWKELEILATYNPGYISVTYGAGGSTQDKTLDIALEIEKKFGITPLVHFTCVGVNRDEIRDYLNIVKEKGIENILALRGDPPQGEDSFVATENGFSFANELVSYIRSINDFNIAVAAYPECHSECCDLDKDIDNLKRKIDAGADFIITQLFFDNNLFYSFMDKITKKGITVPVVPGILPVTNAKQIEKLNSMCGATVPQGLAEKLATCAYDQEICEPGIEYSINQCRELIDWGISGIHLYTINKAHSVQRIMDALGLGEK